MRFFLEDQMAEVTHRRKCKGFFELCAKNKKIFAIPPARDRPAAGPPRGPSAALQHAERERPRAGARSARGHRPRAARRAAAGRQLVPGAPCHAMPATMPGPSAGAGQLPAANRGRFGFGNFARSVCAGPGFGPFAGAAALGQLGQFVSENKSRRLDCHISHCEITYFPSLYK